MVHRQTTRISRVLSLGILVAVVIGLMALPGGSPTSASNSPAASETVTASGGTIVTFEGIPDLDPVGDQGAAVFGPAWWARVDSDAGGFGGFANEPSPDTVAALADCGTTVDDTRIELTSSAGAVA